MVTYFHSSAIDQRESANWGGINNPVVDALLDELVAARNLDDIKATTRALDRVLLWNHYIIPSYYADQNRIAYWDRFGQPGRNPKYAVGFPGTWWLEPDKDARLGLDR
jgi:microcin C transport system substrate-binding protein